MDKTSFYDVFCYVFMYSAMKYLILQTRKGFWNENTL